MYGAPSVNVECASAVSPFDSVVQGGDAVWEGQRPYDGRVIGDGSPGPLTQRLSDLYRELTAREGVALG